MGKETELMIREINYFIFSYLYQVAGYIVYSVVISNRVVIPHFFGNETF